MAKKKSEKSKKEKKEKKSKKSEKSSKGMKEGSKVKFHYTGTLDSGEKFDTSEGGAPLEFEVGKKMIIPGLEKEIVKMKKGDKKKIKVKSDDAYGEPRKELIQEIPKGPIPDDVELKEGATLYLKSPQGQAFPAKVLEVKDETVVLDLNHPLAGKDLNFEVEVVDVS